MRAGFFAGTWGSSIADNGGANVEIDLYAGYAGEAAGLDYSVMLEGDFYPGGSGVDYFELKSTVGKTVGPTYVELELSWVPDQENYAGDNTYICVGASAEADVPDTPLTVHVRGGRESSDFIKKWDWEAGVSYSSDQFIASLIYVDSNNGGLNEARRLGRGAVVASIFADFDL